MAMSTELFAVSTDVLARLKAAPETIAELDSKETFSTYLWTSIPYFLAEYLHDGDAESDDDSDDSDDATSLANVLSGTGFVNCARWESGGLYVFEPDDVASLSAELALVDLDEVKKRVLEADLEEVFDGEIWEELEQLDLSEPRAVASALMEDLERLKKFYADAARKKLALVGYTT